MRCPKCNGTGKMSHYTTRYVGCGEDIYHESWCDLCDGTGKVKHVKTVDTFDCPTCYGSGKTTKYKKYSTGREVPCGEKTCPKCYGSGKVKGKPVKYYKPDYNEGCFISTTICNLLGKEDNCYELNLLRKFRDEWLRCSDEGVEMIKKYYEISPKLLQHLENASKIDNNIFEKLYTNFLSEIIECIENKNFNKGLIKYQKMLSYIEMLKLNK